MTSPLGHVRLLCSALAAAPLLVILYTFLLVVQNLAGILIPFATGAFVDALVFHSAPFRSFLALATLSLTRLILGPVLQRLILSVSRTSELVFQNRLLNHIIALPPSTIATFPEGSLVAKITRDANAVGVFFRGFLPGVVSALVIFSFACVALFHRSLAMGWGFLVLLPMSFFIFAPFPKAYSRISHSIRHQSDAAFNSLFEFFHIHPFLQTLAADQRFADAPKSSLRRLVQANRMGDGISVAFGFYSSAITILGGVAVLAAAGWLAWRGQIPVGDVIAYQMLYLVAAQSIQGIALLLPDLSTIREGLDSAKELLALPQQKEGGISVGDIGKIECRRISFSYAGSSRKVLQNYSASIPSGAVVGISGVNGAGKTTLLKLLVGVLRPEEGEVFVDGRPFGELDAVAFRRHVGAVFQDNLLFTGTLRDNITLRDPSFTDADIEAALAISGADRIVARLPQGLNTMVGNRGQSLSGGERQRVAIARALIRNPSLLLLDEVTNHLDAEGRISFCKLLDVIRGKRTVLLVSHDPEVLQRCDLLLHLAPLPSPAFVR